MKKKKVLPRAIARAKEGEGGSSRRRMSEEGRNEGKEASSSLCFWKWKGRSTV